MGALREMIGARVRIELLYFDGCPSHERLLPVLERMLAQRGISEPILQLQVESQQAALASRFLGSPTLRIDGADVEPGAELRSDFGMKCRLYRGADGRTQGTPSEEMIARALAVARR